MMRPGMGSMHCCKRASKHLQREGPVKEGKGCNQVKGTHLWGQQTDNTSTSGHRKNASMKLGLLGCSRTCLRGPSIVVLSSGVGKEWL
jgi:hypothetical protein